MNIIGAIALPVFLVAGFFGPVIAGVYLLVKLNGRARA